MSAFAIVVLCFLLFTESGQCLLMFGLAACAACAGLLVIVASMLAVLSAFA